MSNMVTEYRLAKKNELYYPQVRVKKFLFWSRWKRIGIHPEGFGLYESSDFSYGLTKEFALGVVKQFKEWFLKENNNSIEYINL